VHVDQGDPQLDRDPGVGVDIGEKNSELTLIRKTNGIPYSITNIIESELSNKNSNTVNS
jgi:hypothetical protein